MCSIRYILSYCIAWENLYFSSMSGGKYNAIITLVRIDGDYLHNFTYNIDGLLQEDGKMLWITLSKVAFSFIGFTK